MIEQLLRNIGFSDKEAKLYLTLLRYGMQTTSFLAQKANMNRGTTHVIAHSLLKKGLVVKTSKADAQYFSPLSPDHLVSYMEHKEQEARAKKEKIKSMMGDLMAIQSPLTAKPKIEFFDGPQGARMVLEDTLNAKEKVLRAFLSIGDVADFVGPEFFNDYTTKRIKKGYALHVIRTLAKDKKALARDVYAKRYMTSIKENREVRYVSDNLGFPITTYLYDNKLAIISSQEENFALIIQSKELADMQKRLFEWIWVSLGKRGK